MGSSFLSVCLDLVTNTVWEGGEGFKLFLSMCLHLVTNTDMGFFRRRGHF